MQRRVNWQKEHNVSPVVAVTNASSARMDLLVGGQTTSVTSQTIALENLPNALKMQGYRMDKSAITTCRTAFLVSVNHVMHNVKLTLVSKLQWRSNNQSITGIILYQSRHMSALLPVCTSFH